MLVIGPSPFVSNLCYSVFKVEPYSFCSFDCRYCYASWYAIQENVAFFEKTVKKISRLKAGVIPFRLATLTEPFQEIEIEKRISLKILKISLRYSVPIIINTKSDLIIEKPWKDIILKLYDKSLIIIQVTLITYEKTYSKILEPKAPDPLKRVKLCEYFASEGVPVIVRLQPFIPGIFKSDDIAEYFSLLKAANVKQVIVESLRCSKSDLCYYKKLTGADIYSKSEYWISFSLKRPEADIVKLSHSKLYEIFSMLKHKAGKIGLKFATCKEGLFDLHTAENCCGINYLENYKLRPTLFEAWKVYIRNGKIPKIKDLHENFCNNERYLCVYKLHNYPRILRKGLKVHEKILAKTLDDPKLIIRIAPAFAKSNGNFLMSIHG